jgi:hypothetical protein
VVLSKVLLALPDLKVLPALTVLKDQLVLKA